MPRSRRPRRPQPRRPQPLRRGPTSTLRAGPGEFAAALPDLLGFPPTESLVLLCLGGGDRPDRRLGLNLRVDLLPAEVDAEVAPQVVAPLGRVRPAGVLLFVVTADPDDQVAAGPPDPLGPGAPRSDAGARPTVPDLPRRALVRAVVDELTALGVPTVDAVLVRDGRWWSYADVDPATGAGPGTPLDPGGSRLAGLAALRGEVVDADRDAVVARAWPSRPPSAELVHACTRADAQLEVRLLRGASLPDVVDEEWAAVRAAVDAHLPGSRSALPDDEVARVAVSLTLVPVRDRVLTLASGEDDDLTAAVEALGADLNARLPDELAAVPALLLGFTAWVRGAGVLAVAALERSMACEPTTMGELLLQAVRGGAEPAVLRAAMLGPADADAA
ncbi:DUF4192 domain-containing protein [Klenkia brasiliensis]|uniref:DUF4192 domain-containing protein n=1 Tax=Klenkia brasiliensis TaxID=333142 RepID=A0A1G7ZQG0_9ACTN|nr:DUF4192 domain-containing protein [Klenkia brasiliensis]SDH10875.1 protein of unknown function [Klenkia brasiliensis]